MMNKSKMLLRRFGCFFLILTMLLGLCACGTASPAAEDSEEAGEAETAENTEQKILHVGETFCYTSLDVHKEYYGWYTSVYGLSETLFRFNENSEAEPWLAESAVNDGLTWTITLKDGVCFSNGQPLTADMVIRNLQRTGEVNSRFAWINDFTMEAPDEKTVVITTPEIYPTLQGDLADPEFGMIDLDSTTDYDNDPICTGPFVITEFIPEGDVTVARNDAYWGGEVKLDGAVIYYMQEDETKMMAMQSGELDIYTNATAAAAEIFEADPDTYTITSVPSTRVQFYILNETSLSDNVREAINLTVDKDYIASFLGGTTSPAVGPFGTSTAYGKAEVPAVDTEKAVQLLEEDGYTKNADGLYEKNGEVLNIHICYYPARSLDTLAVLIQEQLAAIGVSCSLTSEEDPDSTYISSGDYDLALYCMITDKSGDPYYFIDNLLRADCYYNITGFDSPECEELINELQYETDAEKRAELANAIIQLDIDDNAHGYVGVFNKITVAKTGVTGYSENLPFDFYGLSAQTDIN